MDLPTHGAFLARQNDIYQSFHEYKLLEQGTQPSAAFAERQSGYIVALRHTDTVSGLVAGAAHILTAHNRGFAYPQKLIHTSLSVYGGTKNADFHPDAHVLKNLSDAVRDGLGDSPEAPEIDYYAWLQNADTTIVAGTPDMRFLGMYAQIETAAKRHDIVLNPPKMAQITAMRSLERKPHPLGLYERLQDMPVIGYTRPQAIITGHFICTPNEFQLYEYNSVPLK